MTHHTHTHTRTREHDSYDPVTSTEVFYSLPSVPAESIKYDEAKAPIVSDRVGKLLFQGGSADWLVGWLIS